MKVVVIGTGDIGISHGRAVVRLGGSVIGANIHRFLSKFVLSQEMKAVDKLFCPMILL